MADVLRTIGAFEAMLEVHGDLDHRDVFYSERQKNARSKMCCCVSRAVGPGERFALVTIELG